MSKVNMDKYRTLWRMVRGPFHSSESIMENDFAGALAMVLRFEGGYSDIPGDDGGATNYGIIQTEYNSYRQALGEPEQSVKLITEPEYSTIYRDNYWVPVHADNLPPPLAYVMFDTAVNVGVGQAIAFLQRCLGIPETSQFDSPTSDALWAYIAAHGALQLANGILTRRAAFYAELSTEYANDRQFLNGWINRVSQLRTLIAGLD